MSKNPNKKYKWVSWETSTHYLISQWRGHGNKFKHKWVKKKFIPN